MSSETAPALIVCAGLRFSEVCAEAMAELAARNATNRYRFVMWDWMRSSGFGQASLLWIVDESEPTSAIAGALRNAVPLLVPEQTQSLKALCLEASCGLYYRDTRDARACLEFLTANDVIRRRLGENGKQFCGEAKPQTFRATTA